jgi:hypothetical protein
MSIDGPFFITPHAVWRYVERIRPGLTYERALRELIDICKGAHAVKEIEPGLSLWRGPKPRRLRLRVSTREPGLPQLVTVLTAHDGMRRHIES